MSWAALEERTNRAALRVFGSTQSAPAKLGWRNVAGDLVETGDLVFLDGVSAQAVQPLFVMASPDVPQSPVGDVLHIGVRSWLVEEARPDGRGMTVLHLKVAR
jgi:hypothetical protein